jgi:putative ABC transport system permease protein
MLTLVLLLGAGCGIAASLLHDSSMLVHPHLPYRNSNGLVRPISGKAVRLSPDIPVETVESWKESKSIESFTPFTYLSGTIYRPETSVAAIRAVIVSSQPNLLHILGINPVIGRPFDPDNFTDEAIISYSVWQQQFAGSKVAIGKNLLVNGELCRIIGVMPQDFFFPADSRDAAVWIARNNLLSGNNVTTQVIARLSSEFSQAQAAEELTRLSGWRPEPAAQGRILRLPRYSEFLGAPLESSLIVMRVIALLLWLLSCVIATGMLITRLLAKRRQISIVAWLGAGTPRIAAVIMAEPILICLAAFIPALLLALMGHRSIMGLMTAQAPWLSYTPFPLSLTAIVFGLLIATLVGIACTLILFSSDVLINRQYLDDAGKRSARAGFVMVALELGLTLLLVQIANALSLQQFRLQSSALGFEPKGLLVADLGAAISGSDREIQLRQYLGFLRESRRIPWVQDAALATSLPVVKSTNVQLNLSNGSGRPTQALVRAVSPGLLEMEGISLVKGRSCLDTDSLDSEEVAVINSRFGDSYFPGIDAIGKTIDLGNAEHARVVGIMSDVRQVSVEGTARPEVVFCLAQMAHSSLLGAVLYGSTSNIVIKTAIPPETASKNLYALLPSITPSLSVSGVRDFRAAVDLTFADRTALARLFRWTALLALILATCGLYALLDFRRQQRHTEVAVRIALGARRRHVIQMLLLDAIRPAAAALMIAGGLIWWAHRIIASFLHNALPGLDGFSILLPLPAMALALTAAAIPVALRSVPASIAELLRTAR